jgi:hypothetical protein
VSFVSENGRRRKFTNHGTQTHPRALSMPDLKRSAGGKTRVNVAGRLPRWGTQGPFNDLRRVQHPTAKG